MTLEQYTALDPAARREAVDKMGDRQFAMLVAESNAAVKVAREKLAAFYSGLYREESLIKQAAAEGMTVKDWVHRRFGAPDARVSAATTQPDNPYLAAFRQAIGA